jgi:type I restriction enzyme, S subunit
MIDLHDLLVGKIDIWTAAGARSKSGAGRRATNSESLYGVERLRSLILDLAMTGRLIDCGSNKNLLIDYLTGKNKAVGGLLRDEGSTPVPPGWGWVRFGDILDFQGGSQPPKDKFSDEKLDGYVQLLQIRDLGDHPQPVYINKDLTTKFCTSSDIMIGRYGASVGKIFWGKDGAYNVALVKLIDEFGIFDKNFLYVLLKSPVGQSLFKGISRSAQAGFNKGDIENKLIPVCTLKEQQKVIDKVNELMLICDDLEEKEIKSIGLHDRLLKKFLSTLFKSINSSDFKSNWVRVLEVFDSLFISEDSIESLKEAVFQLAIMGKLAKQDENESSASVLLDEINEDKRHAVNYGRGDGKSDPISQSELPFSLPDNWCWARLSDVSGYIQYGFNDSANPINKEPLLLRITDIQDDQVNWNSVPGCNASIQDVQNYILRNGDIVIARTGGTIGKSYLVRDLNRAAIFASYLIRIGGIPKISPEYKKIFFSSPLYWQQIISSSMGTGQPNVNGTALKKLLFPLPPLGEQHRIVAKVNQLINICDDLKTKVNQSSLLQQKIADVLVDQSLA